MHYLELMQIIFIIYTKIMKGKEKDVSRIEIDHEQKDGSVIRRSITKVYAEINGELKLV